MGKTTVASIPEEIAEIYRAEAEQLGMSRSQFIRECIEAGRTILHSGEQTDIEQLREIAETPQTTTDNGLETTNSDISETILNNLPTEEHRALSKEEIREAVFGTEEEQRENIMNALRKLRQKGEIESLVGDGYIKTND